MYVCSLYVIYFIYTCISMLSYPKTSTVSEVCQVPFLILVFCSRSTLPAFSYAVFLHVTVHLVCSLATYVV